jgi:hypothetical protein
MSNFAEDNLDRFDKTPQSLEDEDLDHYLKRMNIHD